jgi:Tol biopolymer transport system component
VVYTVTGGADRFTLWKVSIDGGQPVRLTEKLSLQSSISPDGKQIACGYRPDTRSPWKLVYSRSMVVSRSNRLKSPRP